MAWRGAPAYIRCDNGPEFISRRLQQWAEKNKVELRYIQPGKPSQNGRKRCHFGVLLENAPDNSENYQ